MAVKFDRVALTGNEAAAEALRQVDPDVAAVYPITPQTELMHKFAQFVYDGDIQTELVCVESEHSAMSATVGAAAAGARAITATSANGLALMWEIVYIAASLRLPIVMPVVNRALSGPLNIHCDHSDSMGARDAGWIQLFSENAQEVYDNTIQAFRIGEHPDVLLPVMVTLDGFILSHTTEVVDVTEDDAVKRFIGEYKPHYTLLDPEHPITVGPLDLQDYYMEHKRQQAEAIDNSPKVIEQVAKEFAELTGRQYGFFEDYMLDDADYVLICLGSTGGTAKSAVDSLRDDGHKAGLLKLRVFRPFPVELIANTLKDRKAVAVMDKSATFGGLGGPVFNEVRSALYGKSTAPIVNYIYGLGGRGINTTQICSIGMDIIEGRTDTLVRYFGVRE